MGADGVVRACQFQLKPAVEVPDTGTTSAADRCEPWHQERATHETRPADYLREGFREALARGPLRYRLDIQIADLTGPSVLDASEIWQQPWHELARIELHEPMAVADEQALQLNIANAPSTLDLFTPARPTDATSISWYRSVVYAKAPRARVRHAAPREMARRQRT